MKLDLGEALLQEVFQSVLKFSGGVYVAACDQKHKFIPISYKPPAERHLSKFEVQAAASMGFDIRRIQASLVLEDSHRLTLSAEAVEKTPNSSFSLTQENYSVRRIELSVSTNERVCWTFVDVEEVKSKTILEPMPQQQSKRDDLKLYSTKGSSFVFEAVSVSVPHNLSMFM